MDGAWESKKDGMVTFGLKRPCCLSHQGLDNAALNSEWMLT